MISFGIFSAHICLKILHSSMPLIVLYLTLALVSALLEAPFRRAGAAPKPGAGAGRAGLFKAVAMLVFLFAGVLTIDQAPTAALSRFILACMNETQCAAKKI